MFGIAFNLGRVFDPESSEEIRHAFIQYSVYTAVHAVFSLPIIAGAICMVRLRCYLFALVAAWLAIVPFLGPCYVVAIPFGIWALIVLRNPEVKAGFVKAAQRREGAAK